MKNARRKPAVILATIALLIGTASAAAAALPDYPKHGCYWSGVYRVCYTNTIHYGTYYPAYYCLDLGNKRLGGILMARQVEMADHKCARDGY